MNAASKILTFVVLFAAAVCGGYFFTTALSGLARDAEPERAATTEAVLPSAPLARRRVPVGVPEQAGQEPQVPAESRWARTNRDAIALLDAERYEEAIELFEQCLVALPDEPVFARNLAESLVRLALRDHEVQRPCEHCLETLERATELAPERAELAELLRRWRAEAKAEEGFWRESSQHFDLAYDGARDELLWGSHRILNALEGVYDDLVYSYGASPVEPGGTRISVVLYRRESFGRLTNLGDWAGGAFDGTVRVPVEDFGAEEAGLKRVLRHEIVHAFNRVFGGGNVPGWLNEGLAQWLELERVRAVAAARVELEGQKLFPLERLQGSLASWDDEREIALAYSQSLLLCDHIATVYGERVLFEMVEGCALGDAPEVTFERVTRVALDLALQDLAASL